MIRFAAVGTNFITDNMLEACKTLDDFRLYAIHSRNEERAKAYAQQWGAETYFTDLDALAACPDVDAVYLATPNFTHRDYAMKMLEAGKHVIVEKSATANSREWLEVMSKAREKGLVVMEALRFLHNPNFYIIKDNLSKLGVIRRAAFSCAQYSRRYDNFKAGIIENAFVPEMANGALMDLGVYATNFMTGLFGSPADISASCIKLHNGVDAVGTINAVYDDFIVTLSYGKVYTNSNHCEIQGEDAYMIVDNMTVPTSLTINYRNGETETIEMEKYDFKDELRMEVADFIKMINKEMSPDIYNSYTTMSLQVMDEVRKQLCMVFPKND